MRALRICQLCAVDFTLQHFLLPLVDGLLAKGWNVTSVCSDGKYGVEIHQRGYQYLPINISRSMLDVFSHVRTVWVLYRLFRRESFDVLHVHTPVAAWLGRIAGRLARVPLIVYTTHGFYFHDEMPKYKYRFYVWLERLSGGLTDLLFTQSSEDASSAVVEGIATQGNIVVIGNGVCIDLFTPVNRERKVRVRAALGIPGGASVVGVVARIVREKGLVEFLDAAVQLGQRFPNAHFLLVGERLISDHGVSLEAELQDARTKLGPRLMVVGYRSDVADVLSAIDIFCLPSYREGMPRSIIEAMMMELPVVATNIRGSREEVIDGETGLLVPTHSSTRLTQALSRLITDQNLSCRMGKAGRQRALKLYDERRVVARQIDAITARWHDMLRP
ncbi:MAG: putative glycosyltransferase EpsD [Nitrosomonadaceae bacterium]|nr:putative glycosyltransferase EpsD [Nitrosomonadaceae bacterium]